MKESERSEAEGSGLDSGPLPEVLERLCDAMHGLDPDWNLEVWLIKKAEAEIELLKMDLERERIKLEQKIHRVDSIANRLEPEIEVFKANQTNLFDCFDIAPVNANNSFVPANIQNEDLIDHPHPAKNLLNYLPGEVSDDPLLAVVAQMVLFEMDNLMSRDVEMVSIKQLNDVLSKRRISPEEVDEAIDHLLMAGAIHEIEEDCFIPDE
ncbi:hypothetical protein OAJ94_04700 [Deltaproteobacteria bacterium]|nr:hypothetical protein [Deltaproteobacteria bacterium]